MPTYHPPPLTRRIKLLTPNPNLAPDETGAPDFGTYPPVAVPVMANRRDTTLALEELGDSTQVISGVTVWTIRERDMAGVEELVGDDGATYFMRSPPIVRGGDVTGMRTYWLELPTERRSG